MSKTVLDLLRGAVRPLTLFAFAGAIIVAVFLDRLPGEALLAIGGPLLGSWNSERKRPPPAE